ncbi:transposase [Aneurinibacillus terranovensis]|uniref:transposase n=1 Tax=Aneurinibacillus terranovensis TaxID=278991 RepID=UPI001B7FAD5B
MEQGKSVPQVAKELGISEKTLYAWVKPFKKDVNQAFPGSGNLKPEDAAIRELQKQIKDLQEENAILKKARHIYIKDRK